MDAGALDAGDHEALDARLARGIDAPADAVAVTDAPPAVDAAGPRVELGEGAIDFRPIVDGDTLLLARGCQGSQHVWVALRTHELIARAMIVTVSLDRAADGARISADFMVRLSLSEEPEGFATTGGITLQVPTPDADLDTDLRLSADVQDTAGRTAHAERRVRIAWGTEVCGE